jgi:hypothetical protein
MGVFVIWIEQERPGLLQQCPTTMLHAKEIRNYGEYSDVTSLTVRSDYHMNLRVSIIHDDSNKN